MEDELRLALLFAGTCFIIAVLAHGIWKIRKNTKPSSKPRLEPRQWADTGDDASHDSESGTRSHSEGFDELGIGQVRVVSSGSDERNQSNSVSVSDEQHAVDEYNNDSSSHHSQASTGSSKAKSFYGSDDSAGSRRPEQTSHDGSKVSGSVSSPDEADDDFATVSDDNDNASNSNAATEDKSSEKSAPKEKVADKPKLYGSVVSNPKPHLQGAAAASSEDESFSANAFPEPPGFLLRESDDEPSVQSNAASTDSRENSAPQGSNNSQSASSEHKSPEVDDFSLDSPDTQPSVSETSEGNVGTEGAKGAEILSASGLGEQAKRFMKGKRSKPISRKRQEPKLGDDQMRIDFDDNVASAANTANNTEERANSQAGGASASESQSQNADATQQVDQEVLVLNVKAPEDGPIAGAALLPMLLTLGFKFGDQDIFHRHVNSNGKGPVLFSLANMFKPGIFDIDNLETFNTQGVSLFMILPIEGDPHQVFNMMHNAARKLADEFGGQVLDGRRSVLTKQGLQQYMEKIREFERKRMITRQ
ncbi:cell division protein ZipA [Alteromonas sp. 1_MG-2023]|uniref:cell division protein ZipA n=1 Tax=Alteromonas sp. 1_MG-2023 TaxID=3062669 RepID=UPI0026E2AEFD|nr:cell division protein ZipA [Alteromonas sp. 1_MG-2023]MDO6566062.1 cell division protein ZipA [Alteromonas sp. 1_MG-2023]